MIKAIIVDDEQHCIDRLRHLLEEHCTNTVSLLGCFKNISSGLTGIHKLRPDLVFLDVQIDDETAFDLLKQVTNINFEVIFTTAYEKYAVRAFRFSAFDYLLKPIDPEELALAIDKLKEKVSAKEMSQKFEVLFHNLKIGNNASKKISVPTINGFTFLQVNNIIRCQSEVNYTTLFLKDKQKLTVAKTLKEFEELLAEYNFYRVHNSHLINLEYIKSYNKGKGGFVTMLDNTTIEVSTRRKEDFLKKISEL